MKKWKVLITRELPKSCMDILYNNFDIILNPNDRPLSYSELIENSKVCDAIVSQLVDKIDENFFNSAKNLKVIANYAVGYDNIDIKSATKHNVMITNTPDVLTNATAELAWALLFAASRHIVSSDAFFRHGKYKSWAPTLFLGQGITGKTLGVIGAGRIGSAFLKKSKGFDMKLLYHDIKQNIKLEQSTGAKYVDKETLLKESDFISIHIPLTFETRHLISQKEFKLMKKTAILINTARGPIVDEKVLVEALKNGEIYAAGLDVYENEPKAVEELYHMDNVVLLPHIGSATYDSRTDMGILAVNNILDAYKGKVPRTLVNEEVLEKLNK